MPNMSRRAFVGSTAMAAAVGLQAKLAISPAFAQKTPDPSTGFYKYTVGSIKITALYDGIWEKPHDPAFIKNASVEETKDALAKAGMTTDFVPIPLTVIVLTINGRHILVDAGSGGGQWQPTAGRLHRNMIAAGLDPQQVKTVLISHFHPDHIFGLMEKGTNKPVFPDAELIVTAAGPSRAGSRGCPRHARLSASAFRRCFRSGRTSRWWSARRRSHRAFALLMRPDIRQDMLPIWLRPETSSSWSRTIRPTCRRCWRRIRSGKEPTTRMARLP